jgi:tetratricopeptide (TPR) repeat protein
VARQAAEDFLGAAERHGDPTQVMLAHSSMGVSCLVQGEVAAGRQHLDQAWARYEPEQHRPLAFVTTFEPGAAIHTWQAIGAWLSGQFGEATRLKDEAFAAARAVDHVNTLAQVLSTAGTMLAQMERDASAFESHLGAAVRLAEEHQLGQWQAYNTYDRGWLLAQRGAYADGIAQMRAGLEQLASIGIGFVRGQELGWLGQAYAESGQFDVAQQVFEEALAVTESSGELWWKPEVYRLQAEKLAMQRGDVAAAERLLRSAINIARQQQSATLELRAAVSLYRLLMPRGTANEARGLVRRALARTSGGDASRDVREARAALELTFVSDRSGSRRRTHTLPDHQR